ncbi:hypothetical protein M5K25_007107 [Dendrobium thyrsiflorum]|uniref:Uncharacterized protein n=1 Tax=Dendrobium thyrsiflorum TaxID=117978 RepID=A0ABD0VKL8_DENTH
MRAFLNTLLKNYAFANVENHDVHHNKLRPIAEEMAHLCLYYKHVVILDSLPSNVRVIFGRNLLTHLDSCHSLGIARPDFKSAVGSSSLRSVMEPVPLTENGLLPPEYVLEDPESHYIYFCKKMEG